MLASSADNIGLVIGIGGNCWYISVIGISVKDHIGASLLLLPVQVLGKSFTDTYTPKLTVPEKLRVLNFALATIADTSTEHGHHVICALNGTSCNT